MPTTLVHGVAAYATGDYLDELKIGANIEVTKRRGTNGDFKKGKAFNQTNEIALKGGGNSGLAVGLVSMTVTGISGGVKYLTKDERTEHNSEFDDFDASVDHLPNATDNG